MSKSGPVSASLQVRAGSGNTAVSEAPTHTVPSGQATEDRASNGIERLAHALLGVVLAQSLSRYSDVVRAPLSRVNRIAALAILVVFYLALSSWIALARLVADLPYRVDVPSGRARVYLDIAIVVVYAYLLFSLQPLAAAPLYGRSHITAHLYGYPAVFLLYSAAGSARQRQERRGGTFGRKRPKPFSSIVVALALFLLDIGYQLSSNTISNIGRGRLNAVSLIAVFGILLAYRTDWYRTMRAVDSGTGQGESRPTRKPIVPRVNVE